MNHLSNNIDPSESRAHPTSAPSTVSSLQVCYAGTQERLVDQECPVDRIPEISTIGMTSMSNILENANAFNPRPDEHTAVSPKTKAAAR